MERDAHRGLAALTIEDSQYTVASSRGGPRRSRSVARHPDEGHRHRSGESVQHQSSHRYEQDLHSTTSSHYPHQRPSTELARRHTSNGITVANPRHLDPGN